MDHVESPTLSSILIAVVRKAAVLLRIVHITYSNNADLSSTIHILDFRIRHCKLSYWGSPSATHYSSISGTRHFDAASSSNSIVSRSSRFEVPPSCEDRTLVGPSTSQTSASDLTAAENRYLDSIVASNRKHHTFLQVGDDVSLIWGDCSSTVIGFHQMAQKLAQYASADALSLDVWNARYHHLVDTSVLRGSHSQLLYHSKDSPTK